eukprot:tig00020560_g11098.t1
MCMYTLYMCDTYNNGGLIRMAKALISAPDWREFLLCLLAPTPPAPTAPLTPPRNAIQALHLDPIIENGVVRHIVIPPRPGAVPFLPNVAIIGREMAVPPGTVYADEIGLRAAAGSDELAHIHRVYYPDGVGGRVSRRVGATAHARHLNAVSAVLRGVPIEEALKEVASEAARSRKRKAAEAAADGAVPAAAAPAPAPPPPAPTPRRMPARRPGSSPSSSATPPPSRASPPSRRSWRPSRTTRPRRRVPAPSGR